MSAKILQGDCLEILPTLEAESVQCCITSPPYWGLRDYGVAGQLGIEKTPEEYVEKLVAVFREVKRVLREDGTVWLNLGDSYAGSGKGIGSDHGKAVFTDNEIPKMRASFRRDKNPMPAANHYSPELKPKDLIGIPWRVAFALQADGWYLRQDIIWAKPNPMPESVTDRCTKSHEYIFLLTKSARYFYDNEAIKEDCTSHNNPKSKETRGQLKTTGARNGDRDFSGGFPHPEGGRNKRSVWTITTKPFKEAHFATFPPEIPEICIKAGSKIGDTILDPFSGAGTTGMVAEKLNRKFIGIELNPAYVTMTNERIEKACGSLF